MMRIRWMVLGVTAAAVVALGAGFAVAGERMHDAMRAGGASAEMPGLNAIAQMHESPAMQRMHEQMPAELRERCEQMHEQMGTMMEEMGAMHRGMGSMMGSVSAGSGMAGHHGSAGVGDADSGGMMDPGMMEE